MIYMIVITYEVCMFEDKQNTTTTATTMTTTTTVNKNKITHTPKLGNNCDSFRGSNKRIAKHADDKQIYSMEKKLWRLIKELIHNGCCMTHNGNL